MDGYGVTQDLESIADLRPRDLQSGRYANPHYLLAYRCRERGSNAHLAGPEVVVFGFATGGIENCV